MTRRVTVGTLAGMVVAAALLAACQTTDAGPVPAAPLSATPAAVPGQAAAAATPSDPYAPGRFHFILSPTGAGNYYGWQVQVLAAERNSGFRPFLSRTMNEGESLRAELWADRYRVRVFLLGDVELDQWVEVEAGRTTVVHVDIGFLTNDLAVLHGPDADRRAGEAGMPGRDMRVTQTYDPLEVELRPGWRGRYYGPQREGVPVGRGRLRIYEGGTDVADIDPAEVRDGHFTGTPVFRDGRHVDGVPGRDYAYPDGTVTTWPDGTRFTGSYDGLTPRRGTLSLPDRTVWTGGVDGRRPSGTGRLALADGTVIEAAPGPDPAGFDGAFDCVPPGGGRSTCFYFEGERIASSRDYMAKVSAREAARTPPAPAVDQPPVLPPVPAAVDGCTAVQGDFVADQGLSRLSFDGRGGGHMRQRTYRGTEPYTFEVDFTYRGTSAGMRFDYGPGVYRDAAGREAGRTAIPGGDADCGYDGRTLTINGKPFARQ